MKIDTCRSVNAERSCLVKKRVHPGSEEGIIEVTVGICVKNSEKTIKEAIASVLNQTFPHERMEIIVVDDSSDRTLSIATDLLSRTDIQVKIYSTNGKGLGAARQMVVDNSSGRYIVWVDGDMVLANDFVHEQVNVMDKNPLIGVSKGKLKLRLTGSLVAKLEALSEYRDFELGIDKRDIKRTADGGSIFRVAALKKVRGFDSKIRAGQDADVTGRIKLAGYLLSLSNAEFEHNFRQTWKSIWNQRVWYGYGMHYLHHKNKNLVSFKLPFFPISFAEGIIRSILAFRAIRQKICFLLPFLNLFKTTAWWFGFFKAHREGYGHIT